jgi:hypothetical protein
MAIVNLSTPDMVQTEGSDSDAEFRQASFGCLNTQPNASSGRNHPVGADFYNVGTLDCAIFQGMSIQ